MTEKVKPKKKAANDCVACSHFRINGLGATRGRCHRYPVFAVVEAKHFCGEFK